MKEDLKNSRLQERIKQLLVSGLGFLLKDCKGGNWEDVRCTSHAIIFLSKILGERHRSWINEPTQWLINQTGIENPGSEKETTRKSWNSEVWDTSLAIRAILASSTEFHEKAIPALNWMGDVRGKNENQTWHDEPWETAQALLTLLEVRGKTHLVSDPSCRVEMNEEVLRTTIDWYVSLQDERGKVVTPHYTAFLILVLEEAVAQFSNRQLLARYGPSLSRAGKFLVESMKDFREGNLWTSEAWANGYILQSLCKPHTFPLLLSNKNNIVKIVDWFETTDERNKKEGYWGGATDIEDTALALQGLWELIIALKEADSTRDREEIRHNLQSELLAQLEIGLHPPGTKFIRNIDDGYIIHISERKKKTIKWTSAILLGLSTISGVIAFFDYLVRSLK